MTSGLRGDSCEERCREAGRETLVARRGHHSGVPNHKRKTKKWIQKNYSQPEEQPRAPDNLPTHGT
jgi:hypothetical protein